MSNGVILMTDEPITQPESQPFIPLAHVPDAVWNGVVNDRPDPPDGEETDEGWSSNHGGQERRRV